MRDGDGRQLLDPVHAEEEESHAAGEPRRRACGRPSRACSCVLGGVAGIAVAAVAFLALFLGVFDHRHANPVSPGVGNLSNATVVGCRSVADVRLFIDSDEFSKAQSTCGRKSLGQAGPTTRCLEQAFPELSKTCAACFGNKIECGRDKCLRQCFSGPSAECTACTCEKCVPDLSACVQLPSFLTPDADCHTTMIKKSISKAAAKA